MTLSTEDYIAIQQLYARSTVTVDLGDVDGWLANFTEDAEIQSPLGIGRGHDEMRGRVEAAAASGLKGMHVNTNLLIEPTDEGARGTCYLVYVKSTEGNGEVGAAGYYRDDLVKQDGKWLFKRRSLNWH